MKIKTDTQTKKDKREVIEDNFVIINAILDIFVCVDARNLEMNTIPATARFMRGLMCEIERVCDE